MLCLASLFSNSKSAVEKSLGDNYSRCYTTVGSKWYRKKGASGDAVIHPSVAKVSHRLNPS